MVSDTITIKAKEGLEFTYRGSPYIVVKVDHNARTIFAENAYARHQLFDFTEAQLEEHTNVRIL